MSFLFSSFYYFYFSVIGIYIIFLPKVLMGVGYDGSEVGIIFAASPFVRFLLPFLFFRGLVLSKKIFYIALGIIVTSTLSFYASLHLFYPLLLSNIFMGVGLSIILPYVENIALESIGKHNYGKVRLFGSVGFIVVALVLVKYIDEPFNALHFLVVLAFLTVCFAFMIVSKLPREMVHTKEKKGVKIGVFLQDWQLWVGLTLMQVSFGAFYNFFTIYETQHGVTIDTTIYLWSFGVIVEVVMLFFQGRLLGGNLLFLLQLSTFVTIFRWLLVFGFAHNVVVMFFAQSLHAISFALFHSSAISYLHQIYKEKGLAQQLFSGVTYGFGGLVGALVSGYVYEYFPSYLFLSASIFAFGAFVFLVFYGKSMHPQVHR
jgi:PPP family 3-phenylpropionic acid transporter